MNHVTTSTTQRKKDKSPMPTQQIKIKVIIKALHSRKIITVRNEWYLTKLSANSTTYKNLANLNCRLRTLTARITYKLILAFSIKQDPNVQGSKQLA